jgi:glycosyltransferase involved in cell wall biosynthesis
VSQQIDIIVPVYNGLEELKQCVESIKKYTDLEKHRLILVDDKSPSSDKRRALQELPLILNSETARLFLLHVARLT